VAKDDYAGNDVRRRVSERVADVRLLPMAPATPALSCPLSPKACHLVTFC